MVYAYDNWVQFPTRDLYDTQMMAMAINAAKDMYDKGQEQVKDFYTKYGDFMSPFSKDLERYGEMMGGVRNIIDDAAARGVDLFKSPEGRALIQRAIYSVDPAEYNRMRTNAKVGFEYLDAVEKAKAKNEFNQAFEDWTLSKDNGGPGSFNEFSSANGAMWNRPAPYTYQDLNQFTGHIFDKMDDSFIEQKDGYDYYGVSREERAKALTQHLSGLLSQPLGRFHYENSKAAYENILGRKLSDDEAMQYWQRDILDSTKEYEHRNRKANDFVLDDYRTNNDIRAHRSKAAIDHYYKTLENGDGDGDGVKNTKAGWNVAEDVYVTSLAKAAGVEHLPQGGVSPLELTLMLKMAEERQLNAIRRTGDVLTATGSFIAPEKIGGLIQSTGKNGNGYFLNPSYFKNLHTIDELRTSCRGAFRVGINISNPFTDTPEHAAEVRKQNKQRSKDVVHGIKNDIKANKEDGFRLKVVQANDENDNNVYSFIGDDNRWHTYALVRVYMSDGKTKTRPAGNSKNVGSKKIYDIPKEGVLMGLEIGLHSNEESGTPDLSVTARENLGFYGYDKTTKEVGRDANSGFPYATNTLKH